MIHVSIQINPVQSTIIESRVRVSLKCHNVKNPAWNEDDCMLNNWIENFSLHEEIAQKGNGFQCQHSYESGRFLEASEID